MNVKKGDGVCVVFLKGLLMGAADVVPGVSGGTMAFITGIYERLIDSLGAVTDALKQAVGKLCGSCGKAWSDIWALIDWGFFIPLGFGIGCAFLAGSRVIPYLMQTYPAPIYALFGGLILASAYLIFIKIRQHTWIELLSGILAFLVGYAVSSATAAAASGAPGHLYILILGSVAICAMLLPGISGAFILLLFGQYEFMLYALKNIHTHWLYVVCFMTGAVIGLLVFSKLLSYLLHRFQAATLYALAGLMVGALYIPVKIVVSSVGSSGEWVMVLGITLGGMILVCGIERAAARTRSGTSG